MAEHIDILALFKAGRGKMPTFTIQFRPKLFFYQRPTVMYCFVAWLYKTFYKIYDLCSFADLKM